MACNPKTSGSCPAFYTFRSSLVAARRTYRRIPPVMTVKRCLLGPFSPRANYTQLLLCLGSRAFQINGLPVEVPAATGDVNVTPPSAIYPRSTP
jgi:hypothetical protein